MADTVMIPLLMREMSVNPCVRVHVCVRVCMQGKWQVTFYLLRPGVSRAAWVWVRVCVPDGAAGAHCPSQRPRVGGWAQAVCPGGPLHPSRR